MTRGGLRILASGLLGLGLAVAPALAGSFAVTGQHAHRRHDHNAALLGRASGGIMNNAGGIHTATLLANSQVLVAGGITAGTTVASTSPALPPTSNCTRVSTSIRRSGNQRSPGSFLCLHLCAVTSSLIDETVLPIARHWGVAPLSAPGLRELAPAGARCAACVPARRCTSSSPLIQAFRRIAPLAGRLLSSQAPRVLSASTTVKAAAEPPMGKAEVSEPGVEETGMSKPEPPEARVEESGMSKPEASETRAEKRATETTVEASSKCDGNPNWPTPAPRIGIGPIRIIIGVIVGVRIPVGISALRRSRLLVERSGSLRFGRPGRSPGNKACCQDQYRRLHDTAVEDAVLCASRHGYPRRQQTPNPNHNANSLVVSGSGRSHSCVGSAASRAGLSTTTPRFCFYSDVVETLRLDE
jgi:hypothetical protein